MRKYLVFVFFGVLVILTSIFSVFWYLSQTAAPSSDPTEKRFIITRGSSATKIATDLAEAGLIKNALAFKVYTQINGISGNIPPGEFQIPANLDIENLMSLLKKGPREIWVTIPEGLRREQYSSRFIDAFGLTGSAASEFTEEFLSLSTDLEGRLFPDTYLFPKDASAQTVINKLTANFDTQFKYNQKSGLDINEAIVLASIIERETLTADERPVVAGILLNRIDMGWPLQADATAQYALGTIRCKAKVECDWWVPPLRADLEIDSPFNTYQITGVPPAPIANPGLTSLNAAINPSETDYMFYIHDSEGNIHYAKTLSEHNQNVAKYLR